MKFDHEIQLNRISGYAGTSGFMHEVCMFARSTGVDKHYPKEVIMN